MVHPWLDARKHGGDNGQIMPLTTLLHGLHQQPNAPQVRYEPFGPWLLPWEFSTAGCEYDALRTRAGLADYSTCGFIECQGADRVAFLQRLLTNDLRPLSPGTSCPAALLNPNGTLVAEVLVIASEMSLWLMCDLRQSDALAKELEKYRFSEQVTILNHERRYGVLGLHGPALADRLQTLWPGMPKVPRPGDHGVFAWDGVPLWLLRYSPLGDDGLMVFVGAGDAERVWQRLARHIETVGYNALNTMRLEAGIPWLGIDYDETNLLGEVGLDQDIVSGSKGCYVGQEIVARMETYGSAAKKLVWMECAGEAVPMAGDPIVMGDTEVGRVTSACRSPQLKRVIALGFVRRGSYDPGTVLAIHATAGRQTATIKTKTGTSYPIGN